MCTAIVPNLKSSFIFQIVLPHVDTFTFNHNDEWSNNTGYRRWFRIEASPSRASFVTHVITNRICPGTRMLQMIHITWCPSTRQRFHVGISTRCDLCSCNSSGRMKEWSVRVCVYDGLLCLGALTSRWQSVSSELETETPMHAHAHSSEMRRANNYNKYHNYEMSSVFGACVRVRVWCVCMCMHMNRSGNVCFI